jgi:Fur family ferric uptake transcriptional regulator
MVCEQRKKMIEFQSDKLDEVLREVAAREQFRAAGHTLVIRGVCAECNAARAAKRRLVM